MSHRIIHSQCRRCARTPVRDKTCREKESTMLTSSTTAWRQNFLGATDFPGKFCRRATIFPRKFCSCDRISCDTGTWTLAKWNRENRNLVEASESLSCSGRDLRCLRMEGWKCSASSSLCCCCGSQYWSLPTMNWHGSVFCRGVSTPKWTEIVPFLSFSKRLETTSSMDSHAEVSFRSS